MELHEKFFYLLLGCALGYVLGRIHASQRHIEEELHEVDEIVKQNKRRDETGFMRHPLIADAMVLLSVGLCFWAAISTQLTNNELKDTTNRLEKNDEKDEIQDAMIVGLVDCNQNFLLQTVEALNNRTDFTQDRANANVELQRAQSKFLEIILIEPPVTEDKARVALESYFSYVQNFVEVSEEAKLNSEKYPYPNEQALRTCVNDAVQKAQEKTDAVE